MHDKYFVTIFRMFSEDAASGPAHTVSSLGFIPLIYKHGGHKSNSSNSFPIIRCGQGWNVNRIYSRTPRRKQWNRVRSGKRGGEVRLLEYFLIRSPFFQVDLKCILSAHIAPITLCSALKSGLHFLFRCSTKDIERGSVPCTLHRCMRMLLSTV